MSAPALPRWTVAVALSAAALQLAAFAALQDRGFDLTDEAFYLIHIREPFAFFPKFTFFDVLLHPVFTLLGGSIAALRALGFLVLTALGGLLAYAVARLPDRHGRPLLGPSETAVAAALGALLQSFYHTLWLNTPSYNWLDLVGCLTVALALTFAPRRGWRPAVAGGLLAALGGMLVGFAKAPAALLLGLFYLGFVTLAAPSRAQALRSFAVAAIATAALAAGVLAFLLAPSELLAHFRGFEQRASHTSFSDLVGVSLRRFLRRGWGFAYVLALGLAIFAGTRWANPERHGRTVKRLALAASLAAAAVIAVAFAFDKRLALGPAVGILALSLVAVLRLSDRELGALAGRMLLALPLMPWIASFGTNNDLPYHTTFFAGLAGVALAVAGLRASGLDARIAPALVLGSVALSVANLAFAAQRPYRLAASIPQQTRPIDIVPGGARLRLDPTTHDFVTRLRDAAAAAGFVAGEPLLDFTGITPGASLVLGARPVGPWIFGGYPWSERLARRLVAELSPQDRARAWVLTGDGAFAFSAALVEELGLGGRNRPPLAELRHPADGSPVRLHAPEGVAAR